MSDDLFSTPSDLPSSGIKVADIEGALVIIKPEAEEIELETVHGDATARPSKVLVVEGPGAAPEWQDCLLFGAGLKAQAGAAARSGKPIVGVLGKGEAKPGKNAPWVVKDPTSAQMEKARKAYLATSVPF
jgi:hypothetical protein